MRGKHAAKTRNKQESDEKFAIAMTELRVTKDRLEDQRQLRHKNEALQEKLDELSKQLKEATTPALELAYKRIAGLEAKLRESKKAYKKLQKLHERTADVVLRGLQAAATPLEAFEEAVEIITGEPVMVDDVNRAFAVRTNDTLDAEAAYRIQAARGRRSYPVEEAADV